MMDKESPLIIKCSGGAAAQTLALMDAIYLTQNYKRSFVFHHYPYGTGTFWPFELEGALLAEEIGNLSKITVGHDSVTDSFQVGKIIASHPINSRFMSLEKLYAYFRRIKLDHFLLSLRRESSISFSQKRLMTVGKGTRTVSGGFIPVFDYSVFECLNKRFFRAGLPSPFNLEEKIESNYDVVIHYRIGDKRAKFTNPGVVGADGVMDPESIYRLLSGLNLSASSILVLSDEPEVAQGLLLEAGLSTEIQNERRSIWDDLRTMAGARTFVGSWSQVSQLASVCVVGHGGVAYLPSSGEGKTSLDWSILGVNTYKPEFLDSSHSIYYKG